MSFANDITVATIKISKSTSVIVDDNLLSHRVANLLF
jgi:hypothetical protein